MGRPPAGASAFGSWAPWFPSRVPPPPGHTQDTPETGRGGEPQLPEQPPLPSTPAREGLRGRRHRTLQRAQHPHRASVHLWTHSQRPRLQRLLRDVIPRLHFSEKQVEGRLPKPFAAGSFYQLLFVRKLLSSPGTFAACLVVIGGQTPSSLTCIETVNCCRNPKGC